MEHQKVTRSFLTKLAKRRVLTTQDVADALGVSTRRASQVARGLVERGVLKGVKRGVYAVVPLEVEPRAFQPDPVLAVHRSLGGGYAFSHFTALALHGAEQNVRKTVHVSRPGVRSRKVKLGEIPVHVHRVDERFWATATMQLKRGRDTVLVTTPERTLIDLVSLPNAQLDYEEVVQAFRGLLPKVSLPDLVEEATMWANLTARARLGHLILRYAKTDQTQDPFQGKMDDFRTLRSPSYFGTQPRHPANRLDATFNVIYREIA